MQTPFPSVPTAAEILALAPELALIGAGLLLLVVEMLWPKRAALTGWLAVLGLAGALACVLVPAGQLAGYAQLRSVEVPFLTDLKTPSPFLIFHGNMAVDGFALWMKAVILAGALLSVLLGLRYAERFRNPGEFFALLVFATSAATLLAGASDLLMIYLTVEFLSITSYCIAGYLKFQERSTEAALKYFLYGAVTAAVMLYGLSLLYGLSGSTALYAVAGERPSFAGPAGLGEAMGEARSAGAVLVALVLVTVGFGFKVAMAPFHQWVPDVYDGSPLPVMAWLSVASKAAGMAVLVRVFYTAFPAGYWAVPVGILAVLTMTAGNLAALPQGNIKRMLAHSSVAHAGYTLMAVAALGQGGGSSPWQLTAVVVYLATYLFMNLGALAVVMAVYNQVRSHRIEDYAGLSERSPRLAWLMVFFMLSLAGIPPTAGFWGKFVLFTAALETGLAWLAIAGFINTVISVYYYWNVVRAMFLARPAGAPAEGEAERIRPGAELNLALGVAALATLLIFVFAGRFMELFGVR